jgi:hypothetical protein
VVEQGGSSVASPILEAALRYGAAGWPVLPLAGVAECDAPTFGDHAKGHLTCACWLHDKCISPAKHPRTTNGLFDATTSEAVIRGWDRAFKAMNIGLRTGVVADVLDVDDGGVQDLLRWTGGAPVPVGAANDPDTLALALWDGPVVKTGRGYHLYLRPQHTGNRAHMLPNLDYRGDGGYVVLPPSGHVAGHPYEWLRKGRLVDAPEWLTTLLFPPTCDFVLRGGRVCGKSSTHAHRDVIFTSLVDQRMAVPS